MDTGVAGKFVKYWHEIHCFRVKVGSVGFFDMKSQLISLALSSAAVISLTWIPKAVATPSIASHPLPLLTELHLTPQQQQSLQVIHLNTKAQIREHLTPQQSQEFVSALLSSRDFLTALVSIQLSDQQQAALTEILDRSHRQIQAMLDPQQQQYLDQQVHTRIHSHLLGTAA